MKKIILLLVLVVLGLVGFAVFQMKRIQDMDYHFLTLEIGDSRDVVEATMGGPGEYTSAAARSGRWGKIFNGDQVSGAVQAASNYQLLNVEWEVGYDGNDVVVALERRPE